MDDNIRLVDVPPYAKLNKSGKYYALKKDMPYFADETNVRGIHVIGTPAKEPGKMIPDITYDWYCTPEAAEKKKEAQKRKKEQEEEEERKEAEAAAELERTLGEEYVSISELRDDVSCYPVNGYLAEKFFGESGLAGILEDVLGPERAYLIKLSTALIATMPPHLSYDCLNEYPMKLHMLFSMDRFLTTRLWASVTEEDTQAIFRAWISKIRPQSVSSQVLESKMTLYHDDYSDRMSGWFSSRIKSGTKYYHSLQVYRDTASGKLLAAEALKYDFENDYHRDHLTEIHTIKNSDYPELRNASIHFFLHPYLHKISRAVTQRPVTAWIHPSEHPDQKELAKKLKELETVPETSGYRVLQWSGNWKGTEGTWALVENVSRRKGAEEDARRILQHHKKRLQLMSFYPANSDYASCYFDISKDDDESDIFDSAPFTVKSLPGAAAMMRKDFGRFLCFSTEEPYPEEQLIRQAWCEEDLILQYNAYMNQGETTDVTDEYFDAMGGRELPLFLSSVYREWIYDHIGDLFNDEMEVHPFARKASEWKCTINPDGRVESPPMKEDLEAMLKRFDTTPADVIKYISALVRQKNYFSEVYSEC